ncbi:MAG TPA: hypothetical protein DIT07_09760 [Sphingobacteriaceae bacterium]|nr:hypothetical protein [Sphingobacteriaceae bacterium]
MDGQSKIIASVIVGLAFGAALAVFLFSLKQDGSDHNLQSAGHVNGGAALADDWSDMNDSLGG